MGCHLAAVRHDSADYPAEPSSSPTALIRDGEGRDCRLVRLKPARPAPHSELFARAVVTWAKLVDVVHQVDLFPAAP
jgi:hypothetical protein